MSIEAGISAIRTAVELTRTLRDGLKNQAVTPDQNSGRIGEIYDYIIDSKDALNSAKDEVKALKEEIAELKSVKELEARIKFDGQVYWLLNGKKWDGPYCPLCWDDRL